MPLAFCWRGDLSAPSGSFLGRGMRDYNRVVERTESVAGKYVALDELGRPNGLPVLCVRVSRNASLPTIYVNGGTHGDEPAGVEGALAFLESDWRCWLDRLQFCVIPCLNPWGYIHNTRENAQGFDVNWSFQIPNVPEVEIMKRFMCDKRFVATVDLHEDWESVGYYVYELCQGHHLGPLITRRVSGVCQLNTNRIIEGEEAQHGLIRPNLEAVKRRGDEGIPVVLFRYGHTKRLVTTETPTREPMSKRIAAQLATLDVVIGAHANV